MAQSANKNLNHKVQKQVADAKQPFLCYGSHRLTLYLNNITFHGRVGGLQVPGPSRVMQRFETNTI